MKNAADQRTKVEFFSEEESSYSNDVLLLETDVLETGSPPWTRGIFRADNRILDRDYLSTSLLKISLFFLKSSTKIFETKLRNISYRKLLLKYDTIKALFKLKLLFFFFFFYFSYISFLEMERSKNFSQKKKKTPSARTTLVESATKENDVKKSQMRVEEERLGYWSSLRHIRHLVV